MSTESPTKTYFMNNWSNLLIHHVQKGQRREPLRPANEKDAGTAAENALGVIPFSEVGYQLGTSTDDFAKEIIYLNLLVTMPAPFQIAYQFLSGSGVTPSSENTILAASDVQDFVLSLEDGTPTNLNGLYGTDAANITIQKPCYIVIDIRSTPNLEFRQNWPAIGTHDDWIHNTTYPNKYCNLWHYDTNWQGTQGASSSNPCYIVYFGVKYIAPSWVNDQFNLNFQLAGGAGPTYLIADPAIKNRGPR